MHTNYISAHEQQDRKTSEQHSSHHHT